MEAARSSGFSYVRSMQYIILPQAVRLTIPPLILGIAVFSVGEMTCHPKYFSYMGIVAPQDRKAVYMGYAFLYGVFGSLLGSNLGDRESNLRAAIEKLGELGEVIAVSSFYETEPMEFKPQLKQ